MIDELPDRHTFDERLKPAHVVSVEVGSDKEVDPVDARIA